MQAGPNLETRAFGAIPCCATTCQKAPRSSLLEDRGIEKEQKKGGAENVPN